MRPRKQDLIHPVVTQRHDICFMGFFGHGAFGVHLRPVLVPMDAHHVFGSITTAFLPPVVTPDSDTLVPADADEICIFDVVGVLVLSWWLKHTGEASHFLVNLLRRLDFRADGSLTLDHLEYLTVRKVPDTAVATLGSCDHSSLGRIKASGSQFGLELRSSLVSTHKLAILNIPHRYKPTIIPTHNRLKLCIIQSKSYRKFMRRFYLLLSLKHPKIDLATSKQYIICPLVKMQRSQHIVRPITHLIGDCLDAEIVVQMPDLDHFVSA